MTVSVSTRLSPLYVGNNVNTIFSFTFRVFKQEGEDGISIRLKTADGFSTLDSSLYNISINSDNLGGHVEFKSPPSVIDFFYIAGTTPADQQLDITNYDNFYPDAIEAALDKLTAILQEWSTFLTQETQARQLKDDLLEQYVKDYVDSVLQINNPSAISSILADIVKTNVAGTAYNQQQFNEFILDFVNVRYPDINEFMENAQQTIDELTLQLQQQISDSIDNAVANIDEGFVKVFETTSELLAFTPPFAPYYAKAMDTFIIHKWNGTAWISTGLSELDQERLAREALIKASSEQGLAIYGDDFFETARFNDQTARLHNVIEIQNHGNEVVFFGFDFFEMGRIKISDADNLIKKSIDTEIVVVGSDYFEVGRLAYIDQDYAAVIDTSQPLIYAQPLCAFSAKPLVLNVPSLFAQRKDQCKTRQVIATLSGQSSQLSYSSRDQINVPNLADVGTGFITLRDTTQYQLTRIPYTARIAATTGKAAVSPKILMIGDSITNRGLADLINQYLTGYTYTQTFVGTMKGALNSEPSTGTGGPNCEGREGWETGDYTYLITDRAQIVAPGNEAAYLALPKDTKREYNAFLRASTGGDDPSIIRNGYVLDFAYYQSRFSLATPDIVVLQLGTNDIRDRDEPTLSAQFYSEMKLLIQRIRAAWANTKIILSLPNAAADEDRDGLWQNEYAPVIRKLMQLRADFASDGKVFLAPTWALATSEAGYSITTGSATTDDLSGGLVGLLADDIHPQYAARYQLAHALSAYIACAADNII